jgi:hypothetical protein
LISDTVYDIDRKVSSTSCEYFFYPYWNELPAIRKKLRNEKDRIWKEPTKTIINRKFKEDWFCKKIGR